MSKPWSPAAVTDLERGAQARLVRVEEVGPYRGRRRPGVEPAFLQRTQGERGVGTGPGEARGLAELAHE